MDTRPLPSLPIMCSASLWCLGHARRACVFQSSLAMGVHAYSFALAAVCKSPTLPASSHPERPRRNLWFACLPAAHLRF